MRKALIHTRVSQDRNGVGRSVREQEDECRKVCEREGWEVAAVFTENDVSASRYAGTPRPVFDAVREYIEKHDIYVLVTWEASRSTRDLATHVHLRDLCRKRGVRWCYSGRIFDLADDADQFSTGLDALLAEQESARTSKRVRRAARASAVAGRPHGRSTYGYQRVYDPATRHLLSVEIDESQAAVLREAARRILAGESLNRLVEDFTDRGIPTSNGGPWRPHAIKRYLTTPTYLGKRVYQGEVIGDAMWPAVLEESDWWRLQAILTDPARDRARDHHGLKYLVSGLATCGRPGCGAVMYIANNRGFLSYACSANACVTRKKEYVDDLVQDVLLTELAKPDRRAAFVEGDPPEAGSAWAEARAKQARLNAFYDSAARGELTPAALARIEQRLLGEIAGHEAEVRRASLPAALRDLGDIDIAAEWEALSIRTKRAIVRHYLTISILPASRGQRTFDPASVAIKWR
ncbi:MAG: recombinase family protein [Jatrophihabitantaceae bacterium]